MNTKTIQISILLFSIIATSFAVMRLTGSKDADLPAFGVLIMAMVMISMLNSRITALEKTINDIKNKSNNYKIDSNPI